MQIPLDDPVWKLLFGPYGVEDVPGILASLKSNWDQALARDLYWEKLHHQEDLSPVTYAALPWLWSITPRDIENLGFFSWIIYCATRFQPKGVEATGGLVYAGLRPSTEDGDPPPSSRDQTLARLHRSTLDELANWCDENFPNIAQTCISMLPLCRSARDVCNLLEGSMALDDAERICGVLEMWCDDHCLDDIAEELGPWSAAEQVKASKWAAVIKANGCDGAGVLRDFARLSDPAGLTVRCAETPDLFG